MGITQSSAEEYQRVAVPETSSSSTDSTESTESTESVGSVDSVDSVDEITNEMEGTHISCKTWNGAESYGTIDNALIELFFKSVRGINCQDYACIANKKDVASSSGNQMLENLFDASWRADPRRTLRFVFYLRDCRGGKGEKRLFRALIRHMRTVGLENHVLHNMKHIPFYGSWKDICLCFFGTTLENDAIKLIADQLRNDIISDNPSLCAKYAPSENGAIDKKYNAVSKITKDLGVSKIQYRKNYLVPLRKKIGIVETLMCKNEWRKINYEAVPSIAGNLYKKAFTKHDQSRYETFLKNVFEGKSKINSSVLMPYQMVRPYINKKDYCATTEAQWKSFIDGRRVKWPTNINILPIVDVSGSMSTGANPSPLEVAISLGLLISELNTSKQYRNKFITFSNTPEIVNITGDTLYQKVRQMNSANWDMTTDFAKVFDLILNAAVLMNVAQKDMPQILLVLSDMQFNSASSKGNTNWEVINQKYANAGYERPTIIFWNLNGTIGDYPVPHATVPNCMLLSGFNDTIMYNILDIKFPNPETVVLSAIDNSRYDLITLS